MIQLHITLKTFKPNNFKTVDNLFLKLKNTKMLKGMKLKQIILPSSNKKIFTVLKSPHVYKKSREQFKFSTYKRKILITDTKKSFISLLYLNTFLKNYLSNNFIIKSKITIN